MNIQTVDSSLQSDCSFIGMVFDACYLDAMGNVGTVVGEREGHQKSGVWMFFVF